MTGKRRRRKKGRKIAVEEAYKGERRMKDLKKTFLLHFV